MSGKLCPKYFDTDDLFNSYYNEDCSSKCGPAYQFCQGGKLEFGQCRNNTAAVDMDEFEIQRRIQDYSQFGLDSATGGNFSNIRAGVNKQVEDIDYGKCTPKTANNLSTYKNVARAPDGSFINPASFRSFGNAKLAESENSNRRRRRQHSREKFGTNNEFGVFPNDNAYSSTPAADHMPGSAPGSDNDLIPAASEDITDFDGYKESLKNAFSDVKDGFLSTITFGQIKKEGMRCRRNNETPYYEMCGNALGILVIILIVFVVIYAFYCGYNYCACCCCSSSCPVASCPASITLCGGNSKRPNIKKTTNNITFNGARNEIF